MKSNETGKLGKKVERRERYVKIASIYLTDLLCVRYGVSFIRDLRVGGAT
jgi:hypothetical protein